MKTTLAAIGIIAFTNVAFAQGDAVRWHRSSQPVVTEARIFHSPTSIDLPTAVPYQKGLWQFEISHRFLPKFSDGSEALYGLDGPVNMRIGLGYGISKHLSATLARSNYNDDLDMQLKYGGVRLRGSLPVQLALQGGWSWNTKHPIWPSSDSRSVQWYAQAVLNTMIGKRLALGVVPSYLYNAILESDEVEHVLALGFYGQYYFHPIMALIGEWNITEEGYYYPHDAVSFGLQLETGGHFFKIIATNSTALNPSQYLIGTTESFAPDNWRLGFNITRVLKF